MRTVPPGAIRAITQLGGMLLLLVAGTLLAQQRQVPDRIPLDALGAALLATSALPLLARHRHPRWVLAGVVLVVGVYLAAGYAYGPIFIPAMVAAFALATATTPAAAAAASIAGVGFWLLCDSLPVVGNPRLSMATAGELVPLAAGFGFCFVLPLWLATIRGRTYDAATATAERELAELRLELAREVHDVVAHNLAVIGVQAGAGLRAFDHEPDRARESLSVIASTTRQALTEIRSTIDLLRRPHPLDGSVETPWPVGDLSDLPALVEATRAAGVQVDLAVGGGATQVTEPVVTRTAYRIIQESLTNAVRHAPGAAICVAVDSDAAALTVQVRDDGPGLTGTAPGRGITGMRERAAAVGGEVTVTSPPDGGAEVRARLPLGDRSR